MMRFLIIAGLCVAFSANAADGTFWGKNDGSTLNWSGRGYWMEQTVASDGGIAWFNNSQLDGLNVDLAGVTLTGLQFSGRWMHVMGFPLTFTDDYSWITRSAYTYSSHKPGFDVSFSGTGANTMNINDNGEFHMVSPAEAFANFRILGNRVMAWNRGGDAYTTGNFQLSAGTAAIAPTNASGESATVSIASKEGTSFAYGPSMGRLTVAKGSGSSTTLNIGTLARFSGGGAMCIEAASGLSNLGGTERVRVQEGAPMVVNGICDASLVSRDATSPYPFKFLTYDTTVGFKAATVTPVAFASATASDVALISSDTTISGEKSVHALYVNATGSTPTITFSDGATLKVGDGIHPAGIIINPTTAAKIQPVFKGANGTIDFGAAQGTIYFNNPKDSPTLTINQTITGTGGMVFTGGFAGSRNWLVLPQPAGWTGNTVISHLTFSLSKSNQLPEDGDVYVMGGRDGTREACLRMTDSLTFGPKQRFHFSGWGASSDGGGSAIHTGGNQPVFAFDGPVELNGPGGFVDDGDYTYAFNGVVSGGGWWNFGKSKYVIGQPMTYDGVMRLNDAGTRIVFEAQGRPGAVRKIEYNSTSATIIFRDLTSTLDLTTTISGAGRLEIEQADVKLNGKQTFGKIVIGEGARVGIGANVTFSDVVCNGGEVYALDGASNAALHIGSNAQTDTFLNGTTLLSDDVGVVKSGSNTLVIAKGSGVNKSLKIEDGVVRLDNLYLRQAGLGISYWLDAANDNAMTAGKVSVTNWVCENGIECTFSKVGTPPTREEGENGLKVMRFVNNGSNYCRFNSNKSLTQRSVFILCAPEPPTQWASATAGSLSVWGWTGRGQIEHSLRYQGYSKAWGLLRFPDGDTFRRNGVVGSSALTYTPDGKWQIIGFFNAHENVENELYDTFPVSVGGYESWGTANNFNGRIAEVLAFDHVITDDEKLRVENYLSEKWGLQDTLWHEGVSDVHEGSVLGENVSITLSPAGVLDLNGVSQTIASLSGTGLITNSSTRAAILTVKGVSMFRGQIAGNVTLRTMSDSQLDVVVPDATLQSVNGTVNLDVYNELPPTNGIAYWLDATRTDLVTWKDETARTVSSVSSRAGTVSKFTSDLSTPPVHVVNAFGTGKPAFQFTGESGKSSRLACDSATSTRTLVFVMKLPDVTYNNNYFWGKKDNDRGFRSSGATGMDMEYSFLNYGWAYSAAGDYRWYDGEKKQFAYNQGGFSLDAATHHRLIVTRATWHADTTYDNAIEAIGSYENRACNMYFGEVIAYDHVLTDDEIAHLEGYLKQKWYGDSIPAARTTIFGSDSELSTDGGAFRLSTGVVATPGILSSGAAGGQVTGDISFGSYEYSADGATALLPLTVEGALTIRDGATFTVTGLQGVSRRRWQLLGATSSTGSFNGGFSATPGIWAFDATTQRWSIGSPGFATVVR